MNLCNCKNYEPLEKSICEDCTVTYKAPEECEDCQQKEERLMMSVRWDKFSVEKIKYHLWFGDNILGTLRYKVEGDQTLISGWYPENFPMTIQAKLPKPLCGGMPDLEQAQAAIEKALGIERE